MSFENEPFKLRILMTLTDALKTITPANGYLHDLADYDPGDGTPMQRVFRGREWFGENDPIPMISVLEATSGEDELVALPTKAAARYEWPILIQGFVNDDPQHPTDPAYRLMRDVRKCLAAEATRRLPGTVNTPDPLGMSLGADRVETMTMSAGVVRPAGDLSAKAYFWMIVNLTLMEHAGA